MPADADADGGTGECDSRGHPCRLPRTQCGCRSGERCTIEAGLWICDEPGTLREGEPCGDEGLDDCSTGNVCTTGEAGRVCRAWCHEDDDCAGDGAVCAIGFTVGGEPVDDARVCSLSCNPRARSGCPEGSACFIGVREDADGYFSDCTASVGDGFQGASCDPDAGPYCAAGFACVESECRAWCEDPSGRGAGCSNYEACTGFDPPAIVGDVEWGVCR
jgi:hypothetical protein